MPILLPADRLKELEARMLTDEELHERGYKQLTSPINVTVEWACLQRIVETLKRNGVQWGYRKSNPCVELRTVEVWRVMPNDFLIANTERHRRVYRMKKALRRQFLP